MRFPTTSSLRDVKKMLAATVMVVAASVNLGGAQGEVAAVSQPAASAEAIYAAAPGARPTWQRPAPVTWSSRFNVRWEARWSNEAKYMV